MRIYTKTGDKGETGLIGGKRLPKDAPRIETIGAVDELNASIGVLLTYCENPVRKELLLSIQDQIFTIGAELANADSNAHVARLNTEKIHALEGVIDELEIKLPELTNFILPGGTAFSAHAHLTRAVCRRAERQLTRMRHTDAVSADILIYMNRLSDLLFMLAREDIFDKKVAETLWKQQN